MEIKKRSMYVRTSTESVGQGFQDRPNRRGRGGTDCPVTDAGSPQLNTVGMYSVESKALCTGACMGGTIGLDLVIGKIEYR